MFCVNRWKSSNDVTTDTLGKDEFSAVHNFMRGLEVNYGTHFVRIAASLICVSKFGLTPQELEEILLNQNMVVNDVKSLYCDHQQSGEKASSSKTQEFRSALANTLHNLLADLSPLLVQKLFVGCMIYTWSNNLVQELIEKLYFSDNDQKREIKKILVRYYVEYVGKGTYSSSKEVPFKSVHVAVELSINLKDLLRKADAMELCFLNINWLSVMIKSHGIVPVLFLLEQVLKLYDDDRPLLIVERSIRLAISNIKDNPNILSGELLSRTLPLSKIFPQLKQFVFQCSSEIFPFPFLFPSGVISQTPGAPLRVSFAEDQKIVDKCFAYEASKMANLVYCTENRLKFFDMITGDALREIAFNDKTKWLRITRNKQVRNLPIR